MERAKKKSRVALNDAQDLYVIAPRRIQELKRKPLKTFDKAQNCSKLAGSTLSNSTG
jgi:hypothetical protein